MTRRRSLRPYQYAQYEDNYPLKARVGLFEWPGGYMTKGPFRKETVRLREELDFEPANGWNPTKEINPEENIKPPDTYDLWEDYV